MPSGFTFNNGPFVDLDDAFEFREIGDPTTLPTGFVSGDTGQDLNQRFLPLSEGEQVVPLTGYFVNGLELRDIFAAKGTANMVPYDGVAPLQTITISANSLGEQVEAGATIQFNPNGSVGQVEYSTRNSGTVYNNMTSGNWFKNAPESGIGSEYEISIDSFSLNQIGGINPATITNPAPYSSYVPLSSSLTFAIICEATGRNGGNEAQVEGDVVFRIRKIGTTKVYTKTIRFNVSAIPI